MCFLVHSLRGRKHINTITRRIAGQSQNNLIYVFFLWWLFAPNGFPRRQAPPKKLLLVFCSRGSAERIWVDFFLLVWRISGNCLQISQRILPANFANCSALFLQGFSPPPPKKKGHAQNSRPKLLISLPFHIVEPKHTILFEIITGMKLDFLNHLGDCSYSFQGLPN